jgi:CubicO group peptidase (beta-lactamase class C family)
VPKGNIRCAQVRIPLYLSYNEWQETPYQLDAYNGKIPTNAPGGVGLIAQADGKPLTLGPSPALGKLQLQVDPGSTHIYLQDNRKWGPNLVAYLTHNEPADKAWDWRSGEEKVFDFTLTSSRPLESTPLAPAQASTKGFAGDWYGTMSGEGVTFLVALHAVKTADGNLTMTYDNIRDGVTNQPVKGKITSKGSRLRAVDDSSTSVLTLDPSGNSMSGTEKVKDKTYALHFTRGLDYSLPRVDGQGQPVTEYTYQPPQGLKDGLPVADLRQEKADLQWITEGMDKVLDGTFANIHSLAVIHHGKLVMDEYFHGLGPQDPHALYSVTKSVFSTLFGIARDQGLLNVNQRLYDFYPDYRSKPGWDGRKDKITFGLLLCMTSGFQCDNLADSCGKDIWKSPDWLSYTLSLPLAHDPGTHWTYNGTSLIPVSNLIAQKSGLSIADFAQKYLEGPLGIEKHPWSTGPDGITAVDTGHSLTPREMAKLGLLYLDKGLWKGKRILSEQWTQDVGVKHAADFDYGYLFWLKNPVIHGKTVHIVEANGWAGQYIFIVPEADLVGVMTAGNSQMGADFTLEESFFEKYILASFMN